MRWGSYLGSGKRGFTPQTADFWWGRAPGLVCSDAALGSQITWCVCSGVHATLVGGFWWPVELEETWALVC